MVLTEHAHAVLSQSFIEAALRETWSPRLGEPEDIAAVAAKLLTDPVTEHVGKEYRLTGTKRYAYADLAELLSEVLGNRVTYVDDDTSLRHAMGDNFNTLMTYFKHETRDYGSVPSTDTVSQLLGRPQMTLRDYVVANQNLFR